jgi:hypothetical protein
MSKRALVLVEGQTEERFVKTVLAPELYKLDLYLFPTILNTKIVKDGPNFKGGVTTYQKFKNDLQHLINGPGDALVTTIVDYYGLPNDFPGMQNRPPGNALRRLQHVEKKIAEDFGNHPRFVPFLALHEFEAWLFSSPNVIPKVLTTMQNAEAFAQICKAFDSPEEINEGTDTAPSKRILKLFPGYAKTLHGPLAAERIGLQIIRTQCPHFAAWLQRLEQYALHT